MSIFAHRENTRGFTPRHPIVCLLDICGLGIAAGFYLYQPALLHALLPCAVAVQYIASCMYHWLPNRKLWWAFDHLAIAFLIAMTYVQMWIGSTHSDVPYEKIFFLCSMLCIVWFFILDEPDNNRQRGILYVALTLLGFVLSLCNPSMLPLRGWVDFIAGIVMYGSQQLILAVESPDPVPKVFGYREVQHCILLAASATHLYVVAKYLAL